MSCRLSAVDCFLFLVLGVDVRESGDAPWDAVVSIDVLDEVISRVSSTLSSESDPVLVSCGRNRISN